MQQPVSTPMAETVFSRLETTSYADVIRIDGMSGSRFGQICDELGELVKTAGRRPVVIDGRCPNRGRGIVYEALSEWVDEYSRSVDDRDTTAIRLFDYLTMAMDMSSASIEVAQRGELIVDAMVRLVEQLVEQEPALWIVISPERLSAIEQDSLLSLIEHFLADPLAVVDPQSKTTSPLGVVWAGTWDHPATIDAEVIDFEERGVGEVRRFLDDDRVVEQLLETTQGDPEQLRALFDGLPDTVSHLWTRRVRELSPHQRRIVDYLAICDVALEVGFLNRVVDGAPVVSAVRQLSSAGIAVRQMNGGSVQIDLASPEIRAGIRDGIDDKTRRQLHLVLSKTAQQFRSEKGLFIARHALAGGDEELGVRYGLPAAQRLLGCGQWEAADRLLLELGEVSILDEEQRKQILELSLRLAEAQSDWRNALTLAKQYEPFADDGERATVERRIATYLMKIGHHEPARTRFQAVLEQSDDKDLYREPVRALLGLAEIEYCSGNRDEARQFALQARERLESGVDESAQDTALHLECRTILGKIALYGGQLEEARRLFEENAAMAREHGLTGKESCAEVNLGVVAVQQRRFDGAAQCFERALEGAQIPGGAPRRNCWLNLGIVYQRRGELVTALDYYQRALREASRHSDDVAYEVTIHNLATLYEDMGAFEEARALMTHLRERSQKASDTGGGFTTPWASVLETQILLDEGKSQQAVQRWQQVKASSGEASRLYESETELRCVGAHLKLQNFDRARDILDEFAQRASMTPECQALYDYYETALASRQGQTSDDSCWYTIIDCLKAQGLHRHAVEARLELVTAMGNDEKQQHRTTELIVERGVEELRQRSDKIPEKFRQDFFNIADHRRLFEAHRRLNSEPLPEELASHSSSTTKDEYESHCSETPASMEEGDKSDPAYLKWRSRYGDMIGEDPKMLQIFRLIDRVAPSDTTMLLTGESGTGKEMVAEAIHRHSNRQGGPFIKVNCAAFVEDLLLSELFGHKKGAFTGAVSDRQGRFSRADGGTIFLDEIGDISPKTQVALLRVLQEGAFEPVGGTQTQTADVRVIAATNCDLDEMVRQGTFRLDLYYRLKGFLIEMPPLRSRREDIPRLLHYFADELSPVDETPSFEEEAIQFLAKYRWPGNVRELKNFVRSVLLFADGTQVEMEQLAQFGEFFSEENIDQTLPPVQPQVYIAQALQEQGQWQAPGDTEEALVEQVVADEQSLSDLKKRLEIKCIMRALKQTGGNISQAARILQMKRPRLSQIVNGTSELLALKEELVG